MKHWQELRETQPIIAKILQHSMNRERLAHAYIFEGGKGTGKRATAKLLAKSFLCTSRTEDGPCMTCSECRRVDSSNHPDLHVIEPDGQTIKVDQIRELKREFSMRGMESSKKVYVIVDAEKMSTSAANSILKFLEEPDGDSLAVLLTANAYKLLPTILSRGQVLSFSPLSPDAMIDALKEDASEKDALLLSKLTSDLEEAQSLLEDEWVSQARQKVIQLIDDLVQRPTQALITLQEEFVPFFTEREQVQIGLDLMMLWYRDILRMQVGHTNHLVYIDQEDKLQQQALSLSQAKLGNHLQAVMDAKRRVGANVTPQLLMEQLLLRIQEG
ncbi:DNA polymerase III subunit delta' [Paenalkalicoccus suaedae]|uniref:DNA polymerase III subunit delta' n=1 Tax=Paenalkalicoccus suaedae TaxID=2592382 RepID=A0A859FAT6_9BACI|nr:DNA polymerase III subunit delta' [Paenalkalicoccus suaedae]QKS69624.1 DNA polymerase III subunit delta' [Paenalkalicoccus suaedae]